MGKCECKECVHKSVCLYKPCVGECPLYKSKSLFVELPCAVGQVVYVIRSQTSNGKNLYWREERISHYRVFGDYTFICFESERLSVPNYQWKTTVCLTKEEAEKKLKEMGCDK